MGGEQDLPAGAARGSRPVAVGHPRRSRQEGLPLRPGEPGLHFRAFTAHRLLAGGERSGGGRRPSRATARLPRRSPPRSTRASSTRATTCSSWKTSATRGRAIPSSSWTASSSSLPARSPPRTGSSKPASRSPEAPRSRGWGRRACSWTPPPPPLPPGSSALRRPRPGSPSTPRPDGNTSPSPPRTCSTPR